MKLARIHWWVPAAAIAVGVYALVARLARPSYALSAFGNAVQCGLLLLLFLLTTLNAVSTQRKARYFWGLLSLGSGLWLAGTLLWAWFEVIVRRPVSVPFIGDVLFFLHVVPMMGALALRPHRSQGTHRLDFGGLDFGLLLLWWVYLYSFVVIPWQYVIPDSVRYGLGFNVLYLVENMALIMGLAVLCIRVRGPWRQIYAPFLFGAAIYTVGSQIVNSAIDRGQYYTGSLYDLLIVAAMAVYVTMGFAAYRKTSQPMSEPSPRIEAVVLSRVSMLAVLSLPIIGAWGTFWSNDPPQVVAFRLKLTGVALIVLPFVVFLKQHMLDRELVRLLGASQHNFGNLKRLQTQLVQSEKLASIGGLVAGAAHQISNPLTAIIGYSDLLEQEFQGKDEHANWIHKIGQQARRTQELLRKLLTFAKQEPAEKFLTDINRVVADAVELRELDLDGEDVQIVQHLDPKLPHIWADSNQLLQVCFHIIGNAIDVMKPAGGGTVTVTTRVEKGSAVLEFSDTGTGVADPQRIFDPFYTTKPVGQGEGLGLSACYGIVTDHGGTIVCHNRREGGATFTVRFPISFTANEKTKSVHA
jgi:signal transduction histidine kinase